MFTGFVLSSYIICRRVQWTKEEDDLLMMAYLASLYGAQYLSGYRPIRLIRELMHESCKVSLTPNLIVTLLNEYHVSY